MAREKKAKEAQMTEIEQAQKELTQCRKCCVCKSHTQRATSEEDQCHFDHSVTEPSKKERQVHLHLSYKLGSNVL